MSNRSGGYSGHVGQNHGQPEIQIIKLHKSTNGMGLSIVAAKVKFAIVFMFHLPLSVFRSLKKTKDRDICCTRVVSYSCGIRASLL